MGALAEIGVYLVQTLASLYLLIVMLRFLFQVMRADFYNPISQFVAKATNPLLMPLRRIIPGIMGLDIASLVLALIIQCLAIQALALMLGAGLLNPLHLLVWALIGTLSLVVNIFFWGMIIMIVVSWVAPHSHNPVLMLLQQLVEPAMAPFRKLLPPMGGLDLSPIFAFLMLNVVKIVISHLAAASQLPAQIVLGI